MYSRESVVSHQTFPAIRIASFSFACGEQACRDCICLEWRLRRSATRAPEPGYHRRWRATTGKYQALMLFRESVGPDEALRDLPYRGRTILGVPLFVYRECLSHVVGWLRAVMRGSSDERFFHETRIWYCGGFLLARWRDPRARRIFRVPVLNQRTDLLTHSPERQGPDRHDA